jgi:hypothetical protein
MSVLDPLLEFLNILILFGEYLELMHPPSAKCCFVEEQNFLSIQFLRSTIYPLSPQIFGVKAKHQYLLNLPR